MNIKTQIFIGTNNTGSENPCRRNFPIQISNSRWKSNFPLFRILEVNCLVSVAPLVALKVITWAYPVEISLLPSLLGGTDEHFHEMAIIGTLEELILVTAEACRLQPEWRPPGDELRHVVLASLDFLLENPPDEFLVLIDNDIAVLPVECSLFLGAVCMDDFLVDRIVL